MIAALRTTLAIVVAVLACWFGTTTGAATAAPATAGAADCEPLDLNDVTAVQARADAVTDVFAGEVRSVDPRTTVGGGEGRNQNGSTTDAPQQDPDTRTTGWQHKVVIDARPFRGDQQPGDEVLVVTALLTDDNGLGRLRVGATYLFFASTDEGMDHLVAEACSGTQMLERGLGADLRDALKNALDEEADEPEMPVTLSAPDDGAGGSPSLGRLAAPGAAVTLIGVLGLLLLGRVGSRRT